MDYIKIHKGQSNNCIGCGKFVDITIKISTYHGLGSGYCVCESCLREAADMIKKEREKQ